MRCYITAACLPARGSGKRGEWLQIEYGCNQPSKATQKRGGGGGLTVFYSLV